MKTNLLSISKLSIMLFMAFITAALTGCVSEVANENDENGDKNSVVVRDGIVFSDETNSTRTSIGTTGLFYWETGDQIWVDENKDGTFSLRSNDSELATDKRTANFYFWGKSFKKGSYDLTYTGNGSSSGTSVTIKADQSQTVPNDSAHIGTSGDCATATATQQPNGNYKFTLNHKAHYLIFQPYKPDVVTDGWRLMSIEIIDADGKAICGTYPFGMGGLDQTNATNTQSQVTLTLGGTDGYLLPNYTAWNSSKGSWYAVIAPDPAGTSRNLKIKYTIKPTGGANYIEGSYEEKETTFSIIKDLPSISSAPNKVTRIRHELSATSYPTSLYYMWDAAEGEYYWKGVANPPTVYGSSATGYAMAPTDARWYNINAFQYFGSNPDPRGPFSAERSCKDLPNINAMMWYVKYGDPRWDEYYPWCLDGDYAHIYNRGAWFLKWNEIPGKPEGSTAATCATSPVDGKDYRRFGNGPLFADGSNSSTDYQTKGRPSPGELGKYFFLPALGIIEDGRLSPEYGVRGAYWSSSTYSHYYKNIPNNSQVHVGAYLLDFTSQSAVVYVYNDSIGLYGFANKGLVVAPDWFQ